MSPVFPEKAYLHAELELARQNYPIVHNFLDSLVQIREFGEAYIDEFGEDSFLNFSSALNRLENVLIDELLIISGLLHIEYQY